MVGTAVDYLSLDGTAVEEALRFPCLVLGHEVEAKAFGLLDDVKGLDDLSITKACQLAGLIVPFVRSSGLSSSGGIVPDQATIANIRTMVERSLSFFKAFGPVLRMVLPWRGLYGYHNDW
ncbi:MAG: hypothetical protein ACLT8V_04715 [Streptococcus salivarius]